MLRFAICDDCKEDRECIKDFLEGYSLKNYQEFQITEYEDGVNLLQDYEESYAKFDMIFLDIFMKLSQGIEIAKKIRAFSHEVRLVFMSTSIEFAIESYDVGALYYLVKPVESEKLQNVLERFFYESSHDVNKYFLIRGANKHEKILYDHILYIESRNTSVYIHTSTGKIHRLYSKLGDVEQEIGVESFVRCHQSFIINLNHVVKVQKQFILDNGVEVPIRRQEIRAMRERYYNYLIQTNIL